MPTVIVKQTPVTPKQRQRKMKIAEVRAVRSEASPQQRSGIASGRHMGSHRMPTDGAHFEHAQNKRRANAALKGRNSVAVWSP